MSRKAAFNSKIFLAKVGDGKSISKYQKDQVVFSQGDVGDAVFFTSRRGRLSSLSFLSEARKLSSESSDPITFLAKDV